MITDQIRDAMSEVFVAIELMEEGSLKRSLMAIAHANLVNAYDLVYEVNRMQLAELLNEKVD